VYRVIRKSGCRESGKKQRAEDGGQKSDERRERGEELLKSKN